MSLLVFHVCEPIFNGSLEGFLGYESKRGHFRDGLLQFLRCKAKNSNKQQTDKSKDYTNQRMVHSFVLESFQVVEGAKNQVIHLVKCDENPRRYGKTWLYCLRSITLNTFATFIYFENSAPSQLLILFQNQLKMNHHE